MNEVKWRKLELCGAVFTFAAGLLLYFCYKFSSGAVWAILFASVNKSIWESVKVFTMPYVFWTFIEIAMVRIPLKRMVVVKTLGLYILLTGKILFFSVYSSAVGRRPLFLHIAVSAAFIAIVFMITYKMIVSEAKAEGFFVVAAFSFVLFLSMYLAFTVNPPKVNLFLDPDTQLYGILPKLLDVGAFFLDSITVR